LGRILRSGGLLYFVILIVLAVVLVNMLSRGNPDVRELDSQEWQQAVQDGRLVTDVDETSEDRLTVFDEDQTVRGLVETPAASASTSSTPTRSSPTWRASSTRRTSPTTSTRRTRASG
jgi:hypothetical protein